jgi:hypothetical protein
MVPTKCPVSRAFISYVSLLISYISIINIKESTSYFPNKYFNLIDLIEIQPKFITGGITLNLENKGLIPSETGNHTPSLISGLLSTDTTSIRGI